MKKRIILCLVRKVLMGVAALMLIVCFSGCSPGAGLEWGHVPSGTFAEPQYIPAFDASSTGWLSDGWGILVGSDNVSIDPDHLSGCGRKTINAYNTALPALMSKQSGFSSDWANVQLTYPANWDKVSTEQKKEIALQIAESLAFNVEIWHEAASWYGWTTLIISDDFQSAFSWEDLYCDLLGAKIAVEALRVGGGDIATVSRNFTNIRAREFAKRQLVSAARAKEITDTVKGEGKWWIRVMPSLHSTIYMRNFDIGSDGWVSPIPIPGSAKLKPIDLAAPSLDKLDACGLKMKLTLSHGAPCTGTGKNALGINREIEPSDFPKLIGILSKQAVEQYHFPINSN